MKEAIDNKDLVRDRIFDSAQNLFSTYGIKGITMDEIASSIGISKRTLYQVVKDKEDLLLACILRSQLDMQNYLESVLEKTDDVLEVIIYGYKYIIKKYQKVNIRFFEDVKRYPKAYELFRKGQEKDSQKSIDFFKKGVEQGLFRSDVNFEILNLLFEEQMNVLMNMKISQKYSMSAIYESIVFTFLRGVSTIEGYHRLDIFVEEQRRERRYNF